MRGNIEDDIKQAAHAFKAWAVFNIHKERNMRAQGIDISHNQERYDPSAKKHDFVFLRASYNLKKDRKIEQHAASIANVPVKGAYHYYRSDKASSDPLFWQEQADFFLEVVKDLNFDIFVLDFERKYNTPSMRFGAGAKQWIDYVGEQTGKKVLLYSNPSSYQEYLLPYGQHWMNDYPFWCAQYPFYGWNDKLTNVFSIHGGWNPRLPAGHQEWKFWQFSADGNQRGPENGIPRMPWHGGNPAVDLDVFNGTLKELLDWLNLEAPEVVIEGPAELPVEQPVEVEPVNPTYPGISNQDMINLILEAAQRAGKHYWDHWIKNARLEFLAIPEENRMKPYTGPKIENLPGLTQAEKEVLLSLM
jgi:GH25 family lysozyme M1 (1,4-beta-N-acetylmuramidase)